MLPELHFLLQPIKAGVIVVPCAVRAAAAAGGHNAGQCSTAYTPAQIFTKFQGMFTPRGSRGD